MDEDSVATPRPGHGAQAGLTKRCHFVKLAPVTSATEAIRSRIEGESPGWVFTPADLIEFGSRHLVGVTLLKLVRAGTIRRLAHGIYERPRRHPKLGLLSPKPDAIAAAIGRRDGVDIQPSEAAAANRLRLTEQVPAKSEFLTDGKARTLRVGNLTIRLVKRSRRKVGGVAPASGQVFAGLRALGKKHVTEERVRHLRSLLSNDDRRQLLIDLPRAPSWMHPFLRSIAKGAASHARRQRRSADV